MEFKLYTFLIYTSKDPITYLIIGVNLYRTYGRTYYHKYKTKVT